MRKTVNYMKIDSPLEKYIFKGVSLMDMQKFITKTNIDTETVMIYQEMPRDFDEEQMPLNKLKGVNSIKKRTDSFLSGEDCLVISKKGDFDALNKSCNDFLLGEKIEDEILLIAGFYDIDWQSRIIFNNKKIELDFFAFLGSYSQLVLETDISAFCD